jgi:hypothetical protein
MPRRFWLAALVATLAIAGSRSDAGDLLPAESPIEQVVDHYVAARLASEPITPAPEADDATLVRRITLDLVGRIPTSVEARAYVESTDPEKRIKLVDRLLNSPGFVRHQVDSLDALLMTGTRGSLRDYLTTAIRDGQSWDAIFRALMVADDGAPGQKGSSAYLKARVKDTDRLTTDVSSTFFGVNVSCAKCHDHPLVHDWKQDHFYGMKSFFDRSYANGEFVGERDYGVVKFKTTRGEERQAKFLFLSGAEVDVPNQEPTADEKKLEKQKLADAKKANQPPPAPKVSARARLVAAALQPGAADFFARSIVNRLWNRFFGQGLVMPLDQMHSENPPSHPELLAWLARDVSAHGYDLKRLIRGLVLSHAYARDGRSDTPESASARLFAVNVPRPLTPQQFAASIVVATSDPGMFGDGSDLAVADQKAETSAERGRGLASSLARPGEDYQIGVSEALLLSNGSKLDEYLADQPDRLVGRLKGLSDPRERAELAIRTVLSRPPEPDEVDLIVDYCDRRADRPADAARQVVWALLTGGEFRFNH